MITDNDLHGGNIYKEAENIGLSPEDILDFSANINPLGIPPGLKNHLLKCIDSCINYPDPDSTNLKTKLAVYLDLKKENICVGNGAAEIIYLLLNTLAAKRIVVPAPTFAEYERAAYLSGAEVLFFKREEDSGFRINFSELLNYAVNSKSDAIILCNPNNPTSTLEKAEDIVNFAEKCLSMGIILIVDEAFIELTNKPAEYTVIGHVNDLPNLYVIRAFTKVFAIPGIRLGYCAASVENTAKLIAHQPPWPLNTLASEAGAVFETDKEYISRTNEWIKTELNYLYTGLSDLEELKVFIPETNFILCKIVTEGWNASRLKEYLLKEGILIRNADNFKYLSNKYFRVAVKDREKNIRLIKALKGVKWR